MNSHKALLVFTCLLLAACATTGGPEPDVDSASVLRLEMERADAALRDARLPEAESLFRDLAVRHPLLPEVWLQLGNIYARQSQVEAAMRAYKDGLKFSPHDGRLWHNLALMELRQSITTLETASQLLPATSPQRSRIDELHQALLLAGRPAADAPK